MSCPIERRITLSLFASIAGIFWQSFFCPINRCFLIIIYTLFCGLFASAIVYSKSKKTLLFSLFFCLGSSCVLINQLLYINSKKLVLCADQAIALVEQSEEDQTKNYRPFRAQIKIKKLKIKGIWHDIFNPIRLTLIKSNDKLVPGQAIFLNLNRLIFIDLQKNFDPMTGFARNAVMFSAIPQKWSIKSAFENTKDLDQVIINRSENILSKIKSRLSPLTSKLYSSIFIGKKTINFDDCDKELFCNWGLSHFLARSGLHVTIFATAILGITKFFPFISVPVRGIFALLMLIIYFLFSWASISFLRSFYMLAIVMLGSILGHKSNSLYLVSLVCLWILFSNPYELFCADFQLSFTLSFALIFSSKWIRKDIYLDN